MLEQSIVGKDAHIISRISPKLFFLLCLVVMLIYMFVCRRFYHDDAYITLRYALNFLNGDGLIWNVGEDPLEGYSNWLFLMVVVALGYLGINLVIATKIINLLAYAGLCFVVFSYLRGQSENKNHLTFPFVLCLLLLVSDISLVLWSFGGLEMIFLSFLVLCGVILYIKYIQTNDITSLVASSVMLCLAGLTRLDAGLFIVVTGLFLLARSIRHNCLSHVLYFALPGLIFIPYFAGKYLYYGELLPNTFYVKAGGLSLYRLGLGAVYNLVFMVLPPSLVSFIILMVLRQKTAFKADEKLQYLLALVAVQMVYVLYTGGDHMPSFRFFISIKPIVLLTFYHLLVLESASWQSSKQNKAIGALGLWILIQLSHNSVNVVLTDPAGFLGKITGEYISQNFPKGSVVALNTAGSTPYYATDNTYIDMLGLNDAHIARTSVDINFDLVFQKWPGHNKGDGQYVLKRKPDYIILGPAEGVRVDERQWFMSGSQLSKMEEFLHLYEEKIIQIDVSNTKDSYRYIYTVKNGLFEFTYYQRRR